MMSRSLQEDEVDQDLYDMNLVALFASCLDELDKHGQYNDSKWKTTAVRRCCENQPKTLAFLSPWLNNTTQLASEPLLKWFRERDKDVLESRRRANGVRGLVDAVIRGGTYDSRVRAGLKQLVRYLGLSWRDDVAPFESFLAKELLSANLKDSAVKPKSSSEWSATRIAKVTAAGVLGGTAIALTAGAAAPILAPVMGALFATQASVSVALSIALFGSAGAGLSAYKMADRTERGLKEFFFEKTDVKDDGETDGDGFRPTSLNLFIGVSGSMDTGDTEELKSYWATALENGGQAHSDTYVLIFDRKVLLEYSKTVGDLLKDQIVSHAYSYFLKQIVGHAIMAAVSAPLSVAHAFDIINNPFVLCEARAKGAGLELAAALRMGYQGARPVTLVGFGFGALAIFHALEALAEERTYGVVEDVVLVGMPLRAGVDRWRLARRAVAGKFINGYHGDDWTLKLVMQWSASNSAIAGVDPVEIDGIVNIPVSLNHYRIGKDGGREMNVFLKSVLDE